MKKMLLVIAPLLFMLSKPVLADVVGISIGNACWYAIYTTRHHYLPGGDGEHLGVDAFDWCGDLESRPRSVLLTVRDNPSRRCFLSGERCPADAGFNPDPHQLPDIASCTGCADPNKSISTSIAGALCCLKYGQTTPPPGGKCYE